MCGAESQLALHRLQIPRLKNEHVQLSQVTWKCFPARSMEFTVHCMDTVLNGPVCKIGSKGLAEIKLDGCLLNSLMSRSLHDV